MSASGDLFFDGTNARLMSDIAFSKGIVGDRQSFSVLLNKLILGDHPVMVFGQIEQ